MPVSIIKHPIFGNIYIKPNKRAQRITIRAAIDGLKVSVPIFCMDLNTVNQLIEENKDKLLNMQNAFKERVLTIDREFRIHTDVLQLYFKEGGKPDVFSIERKPGECQISYPPNMDFKKMQERLKEVIKEELRIQAKLYLTTRIVELSRKWNFKFADCKIQSAKTLFGSCSGKNNINLSLYLMCVPAKLIDYVILHELCHTIHHDHSPQFWKELNRVTNNQAFELRNELRKYPLPI